ncbi:hypothetical protein KQX54_008479 [Cotesia glomerata]|uniref:Uncharacterized protein n=1 Tax=Cotesia glomerata TaxID=32391 RepID=A0AAV7I803_COTGL|nr:hypothetical protein KQX54_008479 [Cotesia glomerata]
MQIGSPSLQPSLPHFGDLDIDIPWLSPCNVVLLSRFEEGGAAAASRVYVDALSRLARQAQLGTWGGSQDVGE